MFWRTGLIPQLSSLLQVDLSSEWSKRRCLVLAVADCLGSHRGIEADDFGEVLDLLMFSGTCWGAPERSSDGRASPLTPVTGHPKLWPSVNIVHCYGKVAVYPASLLSTSLLHQRNANKYRKQSYSYPLSHVYSPVCLTHK
jgi:hypothetical protein